MFKLAIISLVLLLGAAYGAENDNGVNWALLVAGSNTYFNYRHQADVCHAYQIIHRYGIPDERIVVMMYDDIANDEENPTKGIIINRPNGKDVYNGTLKDYTKETVTPKNFLKILQGQAIEVGSKKVINSGPNDNVFVFFSDHGAPGLIAFPDEYLYAKDLNKAIKNMHVNKRYKNLVFYIEACESGSMFDGLLPENINVYATTAANPGESSYACYYDDERQTYLGDLYSVNWMEDSEKTDVSKETLYKQFQIVKKLTNESHVMEYGNLTIGKTLFVGDFISEKKAVIETTNDEFSPKTGAVKMEDVRMSILQKKLSKENNAVKREKILADIEKANFLKKIAVDIIRNIAVFVSKKEVLPVRDLLEKKAKLTQHDCYQESVDHLLEKCFTFDNEYVLRNLYVIVNLCESGVKSETIVQTIDRVCPKKFIL